jgi:hypothetical protein
MRWVRTSISDYSLILITLSSTTDTVGWFREMRRIGVCQTLSPSLDSFIYTSTLPKLHVESVVLEASMERIWHRYCIVSSARQLRMRSLLSIEFCQIQGIAPNGDTSDPGSRFKTPLEIYVTRERGSTKQNRLRVLFLFISAAFGK